MEGRNAMSGGKNLDSTGEASDPSAAAPPPVAGPLELCEYYIAQAGQVYGPTDITTVAVWIGEGRVTPRDWLFVPGTCDWAPILEIPELLGCFYNVVDKPTQPPPGLPVEIYMKYYKIHQNDSNDPSHLKNLENRRHVRMQLRTSMTFVEVKDYSMDISQKHETYTVNISEGGMGFEWRENMETGQILQIEVDCYPSTLCASAQVVYAYRSAADTYMVGVSFRNMPERERDKIRLFIQTCLHTASRGIPRELK